MNSLGNSTMFILFFIIILYLIFNPCVIKSLCKKSKKKNNDIRKYNPVEIDELTHKIYQKIKDNPKEVNKINDDLKQLLEKIKNDKDLRFKLQFLNLLDSSGNPIFINETFEVLLQNKIKILLITSSDKTYEKFLNI